MTDIIQTRRPTHGSATGRVWEIADRISKQFGRCAKRQEVMEAYEREGGNPNTASTQYSSWRKTYQPPEVHQRAASTIMESLVLQMGRDGRVLIPQILREALEIDETTKLVVRIVGSELRLIPQKLALSRLKQLVQTQDKGKGSPVEELLAERRADAART